MLKMHYSDVIMGTMASQITSLTIVYSAVYSGQDQRKHQSSASLAFVEEGFPSSWTHLWGLITTDHSILLSGMGIVKAALVHRVNSKHWGRDQMAAILQSIFSN